MKISAMILVPVFFTGCSLFKGLEKVDYAKLCIGDLPSNLEWRNPTPVVIEGYSESAMEPQISADGNVIFFNNKTSDDKEMDIHYAVRKGASDVFFYKGKLSGAAQEGVLDGTPAVDRFNNFYFVSLRNYAKNYQTIYSAGTYSLKTGSVILGDVREADAAVTRAKLLNIDMGVDVSWDGQDLLISRADFSFFKSYPNESYLEWAHLNNEHRAETDAHHNTALEQINNKNCRVYAASLSNDKLELYYTVFPAGPDLRVNNFRILMSKRKSLTEVFPRGEVVGAITGEFTEAPSLSYNDGGKTLYYHRLDKDSGKYRIFKVTRK